MSVCKGCCKNCKLDCNLESSYDNNTIEPCYDFAFNNCKNCHENKK